MSCALSSARRTSSPKTGDRNWLVALIAQVPLASGRHESGPHRQPWPTAAVSGRRGPGTVQMRAIWRADSRLCRMAVAAPRTRDVQAGTSAAGSKGGARPTATASCHAFAPSPTHLGRDTSMSAATCALSPDQHSSRSVLGSRSQRAAGSPNICDLSIASWPPASGTERPVLAWSLRWCRFLRQYGIVSRAADSVAGSCP